MASDSNAYNNLEEDDEFWDRWHLNTYERKLVKPMKTPLTAPWDLAVSDSDTTKLKAGFRSRSQDEKYEWLIDDDHGNVSIHVIRHFVHEEEYILHIASISSKEDSTIAKIDSITWEGDMVGVKDDVEQAKKNVMTLARVILECDFENAPGAV